MSTKFSTLVSAVVGSVLTWAALGVPTERSASKAKAEQAQLLAAIDRLEHRLEQRSSSDETTQQHLSARARTALVGSSTHIAAHDRHTNSAALTALSSEGVRDPLALDAELLPAVQPLSEVEKERAARAPQEAKKLIEAALTSQLWRDADREHLAAMLPYLGADAQRVRLGLIAAANAGRIKIEPHMHGMPF